MKLECQANGNHLPSVKEQGIIPQYLSSHALFKQAPLLPISCSVMDTYR